MRITIFIAHKLSSFFKTMLVIVEDFLHDELAPIFAITNKNITKYFLCCDVIILQLTHAAYLVVIGSR